MTEVKVLASEAGRADSAEGAGGALAQEASIDAARTDAAKTDVAKGMKAGADRIVLLGAGRKACRLESRV